MDDHLLGDQRRGRKAPLLTVEGGSPVRAYSLNDSQPASSPAAAKYQNLSSGFGVVDNTDRSTYVCSLFPRKYFFAVVAVVAFIAVCSGMWPQAPQDTVHLN